VYRRGHRANHFAGRVFALLAGHRLKVSLRIIRVAAVIAVDADPMHFAGVQHLLFTHHRDIVFRLTRHDAGITA